MAASHNQSLMSVATWSLRLLPVCSFPATGPTSDYKENLFFSYTARLQHFNITRKGMVYISKRQKPNQDENVHPRPPIGLQLPVTMRKSSYHRAGFNWPQNIIIHRYSQRVAVIYSSNIKNRLKIRAKQASFQSTRNNVPTGILHIKNLWK